MAQWDVYANPSERLRHLLPFVVVLQSDMLSHLHTRFVAPLERAASGRAPLHRRLSPVFQVQGIEVVLLAQEAGAVESRLLKQPLASLKADAHRLIDALDAVVSGV